MTDRLRAIARTMVIDRMTVAAAEALEAVEVPFLLLKGPAVQTALYDAGEYRPYRDVDLLVPAECWAEALAGLERAGWSRPLRQLRSVERGLHGENLVYPAADRQVQLDLHRSFHGVRRAERTWAVFSRGSRSIPVGGRSLPAPALPVQGLIAALHAQVNPAGSQSHADLAHALRRLSVRDWTGAAAAAGELAALGAFADGLRLTGEGAALLAELGLTGCGDAAAPGPLAQAWQQVRAQRRAADRARLVLSKTFPSRAAVRMWQQRSGDTSPLAVHYLQRWGRLLAAVPATVSRSRRRP